MEEFVNNHEVIINLIVNICIAVGTIGAVIAALLLAKSERTVKLRVRIATVPDDFARPLQAIREGNATLKVIILNSGIQTANIKHPVIKWTLPFYQGALFSICTDNQASITVTGKNGASFNIIKLSEFKKEILDFAENLKYFKSIRVKFLKAQLITEEEVLYKAKLAPVLDKELRIIAEQIRK